ncbi:energy-coupling factor transporter transmembrane component T [Enterococcus pingfangensis]|uniref:energy-coupling factor transporter transmembrane component T n=1 Tax=Enterococcus pingfangensis TaxID=2559924 RepID=UPI001FE831B5|nr:energy-coupling factor transporter transmembrane component T [Enterococcus pingfangensis]
MFCLHPVVLVIGFLSALIYAVSLRGWRQIVGVLVKFILPGMLIVVLVNPAFNHYGVTVFYTFENGNSLTLEALVYGIVLAMVLGISMIWFHSFNVIMTGDKFVYLFGKVLPASSLILSMVFRFVPKFSHQAQIIRKGQKSIGRDISNNTFFKKIKYGLKIFSILVTWSLENAIETADSMKARGYGLKGRTAFSIYRLDKRNGFLLMLMVIMAGLFLFTVSKDALFVSYNPIIVIKGFPLTWLSGFGLLSLTIFMNIPLGLQFWETYHWRKSLKQLSKKRELPSYFNQMDGAKNYEYHWN